LSHWLRIEERIRDTLVDKRELFERIVEGAGIDVHGFSRDELFRTISTRSSPTYNSPGGSGWARDGTSCGACSTPCRCVEAAAEPAPDHPAAAFTA